MTYRDFVEARLEAGDDAETIIRETSEAANCPICPFCGKQPATLLCDFVIGFEWDGTVSKERWVVPKDGGKPFSLPGGIRQISITSQMFTCDRPICHECASNQGTIHYSGAQPGFDTRDYCPQCKDQIPHEIRAISKIEAIREREQMWKRSEGLLHQI